MERTARIASLDADIRQREQRRREVLSALADYSAALYIELDKILRVIAEPGSRYGVNVRKKDLAEGLQELSFHWGQGKVTFHPLAVAAYPSREFEDQYVQIADGPVGRLVMFYNYLNNEERGIALEEIYVLPTGAWFANGISGLMTESSAAPNRLESLSIAILASLLDMTPRHLAMDRTPFQLTSGAMRVQSAFPFRVESLTSSAANRVRSNGGGRHITAASRHVEQ